MTTEALLYSTAVQMIFGYALIVTALLILTLVAFRPRPDKHRKFVLSEFLVKLLYQFASWLRGLAEGTDSFLICYREIADELWTCRAERHRQIGDDLTDLTDHRSDVIPIVTRQGFVGPPG